VVIMGVSLLGLREHSSRPSWDRLARIYRKDSFLSDTTFSTG
jgi:hypothetical protein